MTNGLQNPSEFTTQAGSFGTEHLSGQLRYALRQPQDKNVIFFGPFF